LQDPDLAEIEFTTKDNDLRQSIAHVKESIKDLHGFTDQVEEREQKIESTQETIYNQSEIKRQRRELAVLKSSFAGSFKMDTKRARILLPTIKALQEEELRHQAGGSGIFSRIKQGVNKIVNTSSFSAAEKEKYLKIDLEDFEERLKEIESKEKSFKTAWKEGKKLLLNKEKEDLQKPVLEKLKEAKETKNKEQEADLKKELESIENAETESSSVINDVEEDDRIRIKSLREAYNVQINAAKANGDNKHAAEILAELNEVKANLKEHFPELIKPEPGAEEPLERATIIPPEPIDLEKADTQREPEYQEPSTPPVTLRDFEHPKERVIIPEVKAQKEAPTLRGKRENIEQTKQIEYAVQAFGGGETGRKYASDLWEEAKRIIDEKGSIQLQGEDKPFRYALDYVYAFAKNVNTSSEILGQQKSAEIWGNINNRRNELLQSQDLKDDERTQLENLDPIYFVTQTALRDKALQENDIFTAVQHNANLFEAEKLLGQHSEPAFTPEWTAELLPNAKKEWNDVAELINADITKAKKVINGTIKSISSDIKDIIDHGANVSSEYLKIIKLTSLKTGSPAEATRYVMLKALSELPPRKEEDVAIQRALVEAVAEIDHQLAELQAPEIEVGETEMSESFRKAVRDEEIEVEAKEATPEEEEMVREVVEIGTPAQKLDASAEKEITRFTQEIIKKLKKGYAMEANFIPKTQDLLRKFYMANDAAFSTKDNKEISKLRAKANRYVAKLNKYLSTDDKMTEKNIKAIREKLLAKRANYQKAA
jgi:hypothetical protein